MIKLLACIALCLLITIKCLATCPANEAAFDGAVITAGENCTYSGGNVALNGSLTIQSGGTLTINGGNFRVLSGGSVVINGTLIVDKPDGGGDNAIFVNRGGTFTVNSSGVVDANNGNVEIGFGANTGSMVLNGTMDVEGDFDINSGSTLTGSTGTLSVDGTYTDDDGNSPYTAEGGCDGGGSCSLPVTLVYFKGKLKEDGVHLNWKTSQEIENKGFYVEKSNSGETFETLGFISGNGNSYVINNYEFFDDRFYANCYYRLKQVDYNGSYSFSNVIYISSENYKGIFNIEVFPNPTNHRINIRVISKENLSASLSDISGKIYYKSKNISLKNAESDINKILPKLQRGVYILTLYIDNLKHHKKIIKN